jgi:hypothetical protein
MRLLKQSTTLTLNIGPFVDSSDGATPETSLAGSMTVKLSKNGAALAARNSATAITHDADGYYRVELDGTDTGTVGQLRATVTASATHLPVFEDFTVLPANVYDSLISGTDALQVDAIEISSSTAAANSVEANIGNLDAAVSGTATQAEVATEISDALTSDTLAELSSIPGASPTLSQAVMLLYMALRNQATASTTQSTIKNNAGTSIGTASLTDSSGVFTKGKYA